jgi:transcriptional regulator with XRE-family HTH domain
MAPLLEHPARRLFGRRLRHWRRAAGLTQAELARQLAYDHSFISRVESGTRWPPRDLAVRCDDLLGCGPELGRLWPHVEEERRGGVRAGAPDPAALAAVATLLSAYDGEAPAVAAPAPSRQVVQWLADAPSPMQRRLLALATDYARLAGIRPAS